MLKIFRLVFSCALCTGVVFIYNSLYSSNAAGETAPYANVDFSKKAGIIKPLHGVNESPIVFNGSLPEFIEAGIPYVRLHDVGGRYGGSCFVDIPNVFPDFNADPEDPNSYDFAFTDAYIATLVNSGVKVFYRLGVTIENYHKIKAYRIHPPADNLKWAKICEGIIRHYNEGWAKGFKYGIEYWEIWNEPENPPMWTGTKEQFFELYRVAANYLKKRFPEIKVGGYASCGFYAITGENTSSFYKSFVQYFNDFLKYISAPGTRAPLDFFSWHLYFANPDTIAKHAEYVRSKLDENGFANVESIFNEWNDNTRIDESDLRRTYLGASNVGAAFCIMQDAPIDKAMYYNARPGGVYCGLYEPPNKLAKSYFVFKAFNELKKLGNAALCESSRDRGIYVCAAISDSGKERAILVSNNSPDRKRVKMSFNGKLKSCLIIDDRYSYAELNFMYDKKNSTLDMRGKSVALLKIEAP